jgi:hypothetical protein
MVTSPADVIRIASAPPLEKAMVSAAGKKIPVFASVPLIAGVAAVTVNLGQAVCA